MRWNEIDATPCPVAKAMAVIGDSWTILILRDAMRGTSKFDEFQQSTGASRAIIAERLGRLVEHQVLERVQYEAHPPRYDYRLTDRGNALRPVMSVLAHWGETQFPDARKLNRRHKTCGHRFVPVVHCSECGEAIEPGSVTYDPPRVRETAR